MLLPWIPSEPFTLNTNTGRSSQRLRRPVDWEWPPVVFGLPACLCCYKSRHLSHGAVSSPPLSFREHFSMSVALRAQLLLFLLSISWRTGLSRYIEVRLFDRSAIITESFWWGLLKNSNNNSLWHPLCFIQDTEAEDGLYSLLSLDQKRESEDFIFRRPLSKCCCK